MASSHTTSARPSLSSSPSKRNTLEHDDTVQSSSRSGAFSVADLLSAKPNSAAASETNHKAVIASTSSKSPPGEEAVIDSTRPTPSRTTGNESASLGESVASYQYTAIQQITEDRDNIEYKLTIREQPKHSRMCGVGEKADRRPIDPAPIIQLRVITHDHGPPSHINAKREEAQGNDESSAVRSMPLGKGTNANSPSKKKESIVSTTSSASGTNMIRRGVPVHTSWGQGWEDKKWYLENPYYFMYAMLADAETDEELHLLQDGKTRYTTGSCVSCLYHLKDVDGSEQGFFVFPDLSIRVEGRYRLKLCLYETIG
jgi:hypothetical protein